MFTAVDSIKGEKEKERNEMILQRSTVALIQLMFFGHKSI